MNKIINGLLIFLSICVVIVLGIILYRYFSFEPHTISFHLNGADRLTTTRITCKRSLSGCKIHLPKATRVDGVVLGFSDNKDDTTAKYIQDVDITIENDLELYVISHNEVTINIDKNGVDYLEKDTLSCTAYNEERSCKIKMPVFNKKGYQLEGYSTSKEVTTAFDSYFPGQVYEFTKSMMLYPNYNNARSSTSKTATYSVNDTHLVDNRIVVDFESTVPQETVETYKKIVEDINQRMPYYVKDTKISILSKETFSSLWSKPGFSVLGVNYSKGKDADYPISRSLDILSTYGETYLDKYYVIVHELGHSFDFYYGYGIDKPKPITTAYGTQGIKSISSQRDIKDLYQKYYYAQNRPLGSYAYSKIQEFVAEAFAQYYGKYIVPMSKYKDNYYPDDLKNTVEKYLCIAKNNYDKSKCNA